MAQRFKARLNQRDASGFSIVELLVSVVCTGFVTAAMFSILFLNTSIQQKTGNNMDAVNAVRVAIERIGRDAREARSLGDVYGDQVLLQPAAPPQPAVWGTIGRSWFPTNADPIYGAGQQPAGGSWPANWGTDGCPAPGRYQLSNTCLIIQVPVYDNNGWPDELNSAGDQANLETHIYRLIADPANPGQYLLQYFVAPGEAAPGYVPANRTLGPQTLVKGIVGPLRGGQPVIFQYLARRGSLDDPAGAGQPQDVVDPTNTGRLANYTGVIVNLEVRRSDWNQRKPQHIAFKQEVFIRNNAMSTSVGQPEVP